MDAQIKAALAKVDNDSASNHYPMSVSTPKRLEGESHQAFGRRMDEYENVKLPDYRAAVAAYHKRDNEIMEVFKADLLKALGVDKHPKADVLYRLAWERGHSSGLEEVASVAEDLAELLR